jgi:hypothetical protein
VTKSIGLWENKPMDQQLPQTEFMPSITDKHYPPKSVKPVNIDLVLAVNFDQKGVVPGRGHC